MNWSIQPSVECFSRCCHRCLVAISRDRFAHLNRCLFPKNSKNCWSQSFYAFIFRILFRWVQGLFWTTWCWKRKIKSRKPSNWWAYQTFLTGWATSYSRVFLPLFQASWSCYPFTMTCSSLEVSILIKEVTNCFCALLCCMLLLCHLQWLSQHFSRTRKWRTTLAAFWLFFLYYFCCSCFRQTVRVDFSSILCWFCQWLQPAFSTSKLERVLWFHFQCKYSRHTFRPKQHGYVWFWPCPFGTACISILTRLFLKTLA